MRYEIYFLYESNKTVEFLTLVSMLNVLQNFKSGVYSKDRYGQTSFVYCTPQSVGPMKSSLSVHLSLLQLVSSTFLLEQLIVFSDLLR